MSDADQPERSAPKDDASKAPSALPTALRLLLMIRQMSQQDLAEQLGADSSTISRYATGERPVPLKTRESILQVLQLTPRAWGLAEAFTLQLDIETRRAALRTDAAVYPTGEEVESEIREVSRGRRPAIDAETADDFAAWTGSTVEALVQRMLGMFTEQTS